MLNFICGVNIRMLLFLFGLHLTLIDHSGGIKKTADLKKIKHLITKVDSNKIETQKQKKIVINNPVETDFMAQEINIDDLNKYLRQKAADNIPSSRRTINYMKFNKYFKTTKPTRTPYRAQHQQTNTKTATHKVYKTMHKVRKNKTKQTPDHKISTVMKTKTTPVKKSYVHYKSSYYKTTSNGHLNKKINLKAKVSSTFKIFNTTIKHKTSKIDNIKKTTPNPDSQACPLNTSCTYISLEASKDADDHPKQLKTKTTVIRKDRSNAGPVKLTANSSITKISTNHTKSNENSTKAKADIIERSENHMMRNANITPRSVNLIINKTHTEVNKFSENRTKTNVIARLMSELLTQTSKTPVKLSENHTEASENLSETNVNINIRTKTTTLISDNHVKPNEIRTESYSYVIENSKNITQKSENPVNLSEYTQVRENEKIKTSTKQENENTTLTSERTEQTSEHTTQKSEITTQTNETTTQTNENATITSKNMTQTSENTTQTSENTTLTSEETTQTGDIPTISESTTESSEYSSEESEEKSEETTTKKRRTRRTLGRPMVFVGR